MQADPLASLEFLRRWCPQGPWVLTSIGLDRKGIETRTFSGEDPTDWISRQVSERRNVYFHVNPVRGPLNKKATREDVESLAWLHVDIDPRAGEDLLEERERALRLLREPPGELPPPTCIVFSGGGYQGFWKLRNPFPINGQVAAFEDAKRYNMRLEIFFGADNCHNVDRIMRLPGTINWPDQKKKEKGRTPALAELTEWHDDRVYDLEQFEKAPEVQSGEIGFGGNKIEISGNIERLSGVDDERLKDVPDRTKVMIVQGNDPEDPGKYPSRSEALFHVCCELTRCKVEPDVVFAIITDPGFGISESVLDKGSNAQKYAMRQIERANEQADDPHLMAMNDRHAIIGNWGGRCRVLEEVWDPELNRHRLTKQSFEDIRNRYMAQYVEVADGDGTKLIPVGKWWLAHPSRRQYDQIVFAPNKTVEGAYNMWRGFSVQAKPGDCSLFKAHLLDNVCRGTQAYYDYLWCWFARAIQHPGQPGYSAIVMRGGQGIGKSFAAETIGHLFGRHSLTLSNPSHLVGNFNFHLRDCVFLFGEEAFYAGDKKHESVLKTLVTSETLIVEPKGVDVEVAKNCLHIVMASNNNWVVPADLDDRRFFVLDVGEDRKEDTNYFRNMQEQLEDGGYEALLHELMSTDLQKFNVRKVPKTRALQEQKLHSMSPEQEWWFNKLRTGQLTPEFSGWSKEIPTLKLQSDYISYTRSFGNSRRGSATKLGQALKSFLPSGFPEQQQRSAPIEALGLDGQPCHVPRPYYYVFPDLATCRKHWDDNYGGPYDWSKSLEEDPLYDDMTEANVDDLPF